MRRPSEESIPPIRSLRLYALGRMFLAAPLLALAQAVLLGLGFALPLVLILSVGHAAAIVLQIGHGQATAARLAPSLVLIAAVLAGQQLVSSLNQSISFVLSLQFRNSAFLWTISHLLAPDSIEHLDDPDVRDRLRRATARGEFGPGSAVTGLIASMSVFGISVASVVLLATFRWWLGVLAIASIALVSAAVRRTSHLIAARQHGQTGLLRRVDYLASVLTEPRSAREVRVYGLGPWLGASYTTAWQQTSHRLLARHVLALSTAVASLPLCGVVVASIALAVGAFRAGQISATEFVVVAQATGSALIGAASLTRRDHSYELGLRSVEAMRELNFLDPSHRTVHHGQLNQANSPLDSRAKPAGLQLSGISFTYPESDRVVLSEIDLEIPAGSSIGIAGHNGAGKSSLVKLLTGLYSPTSGSIEADGVSLLEQGRVWQEHVAYLPQSPIRFPWSLRENVIVAQPIDEQIFRQCLDEIGITSWIETLPQGVDTPLESSLGGVNLSGGQWQQVGIARVLYAAHLGARLLIMDEPTSALATDHEERFRTAVYSAQLSCTRLIISHRLSTLRRADRIVVLDSGSVAEIGSHEELLAKPGIYAEMFRAQSLGLMGDVH